MELEEFLKLAGLTPSKVKLTKRALERASILNWRNLVTYTPEELAAAVDGITAQTAYIITRAARKQIRGGKLFKKARDLAQAEKNRTYITTGSKRLDKLLGGGWSVGTLVELVGEPQMGKTQLALTAASIAPLPVEQGGLGGSVLWIDTEGAFRVQRLVEIGKRFNVDEELIYERIFHAEVFSVSDLEDVIRAVTSEMMEENVKMIVIDSLIDVFRKEYTDLHRLPERQRRMNNVLHKVKVQLRAEQQLVMYTNHVTAKIDPYKVINEGMNSIPAGGFTLGHASDIRLYLKRPGKSVRDKYRAQWPRIARIIDCGWLPESETIFSLGPLGVCDPEDEESFVKQAQELAVTGFA